MSLNITYLNLEVLLNFGEVGGNGLKTPKKVIKASVIIIGAPYSYLFSYDKHVKFRVCVYTKQRDSETLTSRSDYSPMQT